MLGGHGRQSVTMEQCRSSDTSTATRQGVGRVRELGMPRMLVTMRMLSRILTHPFFDRFCPLRKLSLRRGADAKRRSLAFLTAATLSEVSAQRKCRRGRADGKLATVVRLQSVRRTLRIATEAVTSRLVPGRNFVRSVRSGTPRRHGSAALRTTAATRAATFGTRHMRFRFGVSHRRHALEMPGVRESYPPQRGRKRAPPEGCVSLSHLPLGTRAR
jgi:hypothetical protein